VQGSIRAATVAVMEDECIHGDINEGQILVDDTLAVTGILNWETAGAGYPLKDFDFGEWGYGIFAWEQRFDILRQQMWEAYARARDGKLPSWQAVHRCFCLLEILQFQHETDPATWGGARLVNNLDLLKRLDDGASPSSRDES
jgi:hypothetical protein